MTAEVISETWRLQGARHWLAAAWLEGLQRSLVTTAGAQGQAGGRFQASIPEPEAWSSWPAPLWTRISLRNAAGALSAGAPRPTVQLLGRLIAGDPQLGDSDCDAAFLELLNQTASAAAETLSERLGHRQEFSLAELSEPPATMGYPVQVEFLWQGVVYPLGFVPGPDLMESLGADRVPAQVSVLAPALPATATPANLDLLLEVELPVVVTFGRTHLPLKDVLKLSSGSIVELNRLANEPVEVLINDCVIARGEVVVVDGNYGIRVTEIVSRQERIRSIF